VNIPWPADPLGLSEPPATLTLLDGEKISVSVVPAEGFVWDDWLGDEPTDGASE
jgi:hypothetical protein